MYNHACVLLIHLVAAFCACTLWTLSNHTPRLVNPQRACTGRVTVVVHTFRLVYIVHVRLGVTGGLLVKDSGS